MAEKSKSQKAADSGQVADRSEDGNWTTSDGTYVGTEAAPRTPGLPNQQSSSVQSSFRLAQKLGVESSQSVELEDGRTATWSDPDAIPGTVGDTPEETIKAVAAAGLPSAKVTGEAREPDRPASAQGEEKHV